MLSPRLWKLESVLRLLTGLFLGLALVGLTSSVADHFLGGAAEDPRHSTVAIAGTVVFQFVALGLVGWFLRENGSTWHEAFGLRIRRGGRLALIALAATITVFPISLALMWVSQKLMVELSIEVVAQPTVQALQAAHSVPQKALFGLMAIVMAPVTEETLFRGIFYPAIKDLGYPRVALWLTALTFAATHANLVTFGSLVFFAIALTSLYEHTESLWVPIGAHSLFNLANFVLLMLVDGPG